MFGIIYTQDNELFAKKFVVIDEYVTFTNQLSTNQIIYTTTNNELIEDNIPESQKEIFNIFFKSIKKQWHSAKFVNIQHDIKQEIQDEEITINVDPPKKRGRPKKIKDND